MQGPVGVGARERMEEGLQEPETSGELELSFGIGPLGFKLSSATFLV